MGSSVANPVKTRARAENQPDADSNACSNDSVESMNLFERVADFGQRQKQDPSLEPWFKKTNGVVERFHSTLKNMLRKLADQSPSDWSRSDDDSAREKRSFDFSLNRKAQGIICWRQPQTRKGPQTTAARFRVPGSSNRDRKGTRGKIQREIHVISDEIVRVKPYQLSFASQKFVKKEVKRLLELGVIEPSVNPFSSPIILVKKKEGSLRFCIDFQILNIITVLDTTNIPLAEDLFAQLSDFTIFTSCDLSKAYWQISMHPDSRHLTAFQTPLGLMQWTRMPFGLVNAPATFCSLMRLALNNEPMLLSYFKGTLLHTRSWEDHVIGLRLLLTILRNHGLTVNPGMILTTAAPYAINQTFDGKINRANRRGIMSTKE
ncbi:SCAN domain-containing protein 3, partial [Elysia marginata]